MEKMKWNGETLFKDGERIIFILQRVNNESQIICDYETGKCEEVECQDYEPYYLATDDSIFFGIDDFK